MAWQLLARMPDRQVGGVLDAASFKLTLRHNEVGSWSVDVPRERTPAGWPAPGAGIIAIRDRVVVASGDIDEQGFAWSSDPGDESAGPGKYTLTGSTDLARLGYRVVYPTPGQPWGSQTNNYYAYGPDVGEEVLRVTVNQQAGSLAPTQRRVPGLRLSAPTGIGSTVVIHERFTPLLDALRKVALAAGGLAFDVRDALDTGQDFVIWQPLDRTGSARFGIELGNVASLAVQRVAPTGTTALVAGQGEGADRTLVEIPDPSANIAWGRREAFLDQRQVDAGLELPEQQVEFEKAAAEAFADAAEASAVSAVIVDTPAVKWGEDYGLGDRVSVSTPFGPVVDVVRQVDITVDEAGVEDITSVIGTTDPTTDDPLAGIVRAMSKRISQLERAL